METTIFLAQLWGPILLAVGFGIFFDKQYYSRIYRELDKETLAVLLFGMSGMAAGIAQIHFHNVWNTTPEIIVSLLGWGMFAKGAMFALYPKFTDKVARIAAQVSLLNVSGIGALILGAYLTWFGFMM